MKYKNFILAAFIMTFGLVTLSGQQTQKVNKTEQVVKSQTVELNVTGMSCQKGCADGIDKKLKSTEGIIKSKTSFDKSTSKIQFDPSKINVQQIIALIADKGYKASVVSK
ncbi:MAG: heavy-metal-associated domain-containing protein [Saprospiraceae bacterium]